MLFSDNKTLSLYVHVLVVVFVASIIRVNPSFEVFRHGSYCIIGRKVYKPSTNVQHETQRQIYSDFLYIISLPTG